MQKITSLAFLNEELSFEGTINTKEWEIWHFAMIYLSFYVVNWLTFCLIFKAKTYNGNYF